MNKTEFKTSEVTGVNTYNNSAMVILIMRRIMNWTSFWRFPQ